MSKQIMVTLDGARVCLTKVEAAAKIEEQALVIRELVEALQSIGLKLVSEAAIASRSGQMESLEALSDMAFAAARAAIAKAKP